MRTSFITWYPYCRRSDTIAANLHGTSHLIHYLSFKKPLHAPAKYVLQAFATMWALRRDRPELAIVAVPPIFAALPVLAYARRHHCRFVVDAHTGIFEHARWRWLLPLTRRVFQQADAVVVTGPHLAETVRSWGGTPVIIGDVPVTFGPGRAPAAIDRPRIVVVNTFSVDEPVDELLKAAALLDDMSLYVTGDTKHARQVWLQQRPSNVTFTGFVSEEEYAGLLRAADAIVVLTTHDHTMQRGGYEAMALGKPLVTSDWGLLRETFSRGTIHVRNDAQAIADGIRRAVREAPVLGREMADLARERRTLFATRLAELVRLCGSQPSSTPTPVTSPC